MSDAKVIAAMQRQAAEAEVERLRLVGELDAMRERAEKAEAQLASVSGVTRLELVAAERAKWDGLLAALRLARDVVAESCEMREGYGAFHGGDPRDFTPDPECSTEEERAAHAAAVAKAETDESSRNLEPSHRWVMRDDPLPEGGITTIKMGSARHVEVPMFGLGTYRDREAEAVLKAVDAAIAAAEAAS